MDRDVVAMIDSGLTGAQVARRLGVSRERVRQRYKRATGLGLPRVSTREPRTIEWLRARTIETETGCWEWSRRKNPVTGYGQTCEGDRVLGAHRVAWTIANGAIPDGLWVLHTCDNRPCCNPDHLYLGDALQNADDRDSRGRGWWQKGD